MFGWVGDVIDWIGDGISSAWDNTVGVSSAWDNTVGVVTSDAARMVFDVIADAMSAIDLQEQTIKAQLIYMSFFDGNRLADFTAYVEHFTQDDEQLIQSLNADYSLDIDFDEFRRTYTLVMNSTINEYMFTDSSTKNADDLAAWCRNAYESDWGYADNSFGERKGEDRIRCADNVGLIMGYVRYDNRSMIVRNSWVTQGKEAAGFIDKAEFEKIKKTGDTAVHRWINNQLNGTSVTVVLIGSETLSRPFVKYEICESVKRGNAIIGVYIHNVKCYTERAVDKHPKIW
ncbi:TIR domain-containing protein [Ruminococcus flavefaciens]|uniref:TIR domain-containing protein n=1 Tax=Ruminococcus flavefaciens TaxID=1265 RepID=UPI0026F0EF29|nr:TIR domain-containing protein [Ruminococcus flavefaciens]